MVEDNFDVEKLINDVVDKRVQLATEDIVKRFEKKIELDVVSKVSEMDRVYKTDRDKEIEAIKANMEQKHQEFLKSDLEKDKLIQMKFNAYSRAFNSMPEATRRGEIR